MADQSDVENALTTAAASSLYPNGTDAVSVPGPSCRIYRGWPNPIALNADLAQGHINVTVFAGNAAPRLLPRFAEEWLSTPIEPALRISVSRTTVTLVGNITTGLLVGVRVDGQPYSYRTQASDTPALIAATLAAQIRTTRIVQLHGTSLDIPGATDIVARVVADSSALKEVRRQRLTVRICCWCPSPATRDTTAAAIDTTFAMTPFISLADGSAARLIFSGGAVLDQSERASLYRRDLLYDVEYATTITQSQPAMLFGTVGLNALHITA